MTGPDDSTNLGLIEREEGAERCECAPYPPERMDTFGILGEGVGITGDTHVENSVYAMTNLS